MKAQQFSLPSHCFLLAGIQSFWQYTSLANALSEAHSTHKKGTGFCTAWQCKLLNIPLNLICFSIIQERTYCLRHKLYTVVPTSRISCFPEGILI